MKSNRKVQSLIIILSLTFITVYTQTWILGGIGGRYLRETQLERHLAVLNNQACNPWQYRVLSEGISAVLLRGGRMLGIQSPGVPFVLFRVVQNILIFLLAAEFYRRSGFGRRQAIIGLVLVSWGMSYAFYNSDLHFSTYTEIICYLAALLIIMNRRECGIPFITFLAALNRETAVFIPFLLLPVCLKFERGKIGFNRRAIIIFVISLFIYFSVYFSLRLILGWRSFSETWGQPGFNRLWSSFKNALAWRNALLTVNILPLICIFTFKDWPAGLKGFFLALVPLWLVIHYYSKACPDETRFLLLPLICGFVPGTLMLFIRGGGRSSWKIINSRESLTAGNRAQAPDLPCSEGLL